jgi:hypothetical protein
MIAGPYCPLNSQGKSREFAGRSLHRALSIRKDISGCDQRLERYRNDFGVR